MSRESIVLETGDLAKMGESRLRNTIGVDEYEEENVQVVDKKTEPSIATKTKGQSQRCQSQVLDQEDLANKGFEGSRGGNGKDERNAQAAVAEEPQLSEEVPTTAASKGSRMVLSLQRWSSRFLRPTSEDHQKDQVPNGPNHPMKRGLRRTAEEWEAKRTARRTARGEAIEPQQVVICDQLQDHEHDLESGDQEPQPPERVAGNAAAAQTQHPGAYTGCAPGCGSGAQRNSRVRFSLLERGRLSQQTTREPSESSDLEVQNENENLPPLSSTDARVTVPLPPILEYQPMLERQPTAMLAVARALPDHDRPSQFPLATRESQYPIATRDQEQETQRRNNKSMHVQTMRFLCLGFLVVLVLSNTITWAVTRAQTQSKEEDGATTTIPTAIAPKALSAHIFSLLPDWALDNLDLPDTPQSQAYRWLLGDPAMSHLTDKRILQRYALAVLYYSTDGPKWASNGNWLSYNHHECDWVFCPNLFFYQGYGEINDVAYAQAPICNTTHAQDGEEERIIQHVWLHRNALKGRLPPELFLLTSLVSLDLNFNQMIGGSIPTHVGLLKNLQGLHLSWTGLTGSIPTQVGLLSKLTTNVFGYNDMLGGSLPTEYSLLTNSLEYVAVCGTKLSGTIPTQLGLLSNNIKWLYLCDSSYNGPIPSELGLLTALKRLGLENNKLTGQVPTEIGLMALAADDGPSSSSVQPTNSSTSGSLFLFNVTGNVELVGTIPEQLCAIQMMHFDCGPNSMLCGCHCKCGNQSNTTQAMVVGNHANL